MTGDSDRDASRALVAARVKSGRFRTIALATADTRCIRFQHQGARHIKRGCVSRRGYWDLLRIAIVVSFVAIQHCTAPCLDTTSTTTYHTGQATLAPRGFPRVASPDLQLRPGALTSAPPLCTANVPTPRRRPPPSGGTQLPRHPFVPPAGREREKKVSTEHPAPGLKPLRRRQHPANDVKGTRLSGRLVPV